MDLVAIILKINGTMLHVYTAYVSGCCRTFIVFNKCLSTEYDMILLLFHSFLRFYV